MITRTTRNCSNFIANYALKKLFFEVLCDFDTKFYSDIKLYAGEKDILFDILILFFLISINFLYIIEHFRVISQNFHIHIYKTFGYIISRPIIRFYHIIYYYLYM